MRTFKVEVGGRWHEIKVRPGGPLDQYIDRVAYWAGEPRIKDAALPVVWSYWVLGWHPKVTARVIGGT